MIIGLFVDIGIAIGPIWGYYCQWALIHSQKNIGIFSIDVCAILLISNILRLYFWFTTGFALNLLIQSFFVIAIQLLLLKQCVELKTKESQDNKFWRWNQYESYIKFLLTLMAIMTILTIFFQIFSNNLYGNLVGLLSMSIESTLGLPQLISNYQTKSVKGLSIQMIGSWFIGDFLKTLYFIIEKQPFQFILCGIIQLSLDILIVLQIFNYKQIQLDLQEENPITINQ